MRVTRGTQVTGEFLDGDPERFTCLLGEWFSENGCDYLEIAEIFRALRGKGEYVGGGGAAPAFRLRCADAV